MADPIWYLGPLGNLRELDCPEPGLSVTPVRYGGVHQGLSGARTHDFSGVKMEYEFELRNLEEPEYTWLEAMTTGMVPGPYYLIDPFKKNRVSVTGCKMVRPLVDWPKLNYQLEYDQPDELGMPLQSLKVNDWSAYPDVIPINFDRGYVTPVTPGETITASVYMKSSAAATGRLYFDYLDATGKQIQQYYQEKTTVTSWVRNTMTRQIPLGVYAVRFYYQTATPRTSLSFVAPQIESGPDATPFALGGGANTVIIDSLDIESPRFPLKTAQLTVLEA